MRTSAFFNFPYFCKLLSLFLILVNLLVLFLFRLAAAAAAAAAAADDDDDDDDDDDHDHNDDMVVVGRLFGSLQVRSGAQPDADTVNGMLTACSSAGSSRKPSLKAPTSSNSDEDGAAVESGSAAEKALKIYR